MTSTTDRKLAVCSMIVSIVAVGISALALWQSRAQFELEYDTAIILTPGKLPIKTIPSTSPLEIELEVTNTSKSNMDYFLRVDSNAICASGSEQRDALIPCKYESHVIQLSRLEAGKNQHLHKVSLIAPKSVDMSVMALESDPKFFLSVEVLNARNGRTLLHSLCYYTFNPESRSLRLYTPVIDTSGKSHILQSKCQT